MITQHQSVLLLTTQHSDVSRQRCAVQYDRANNDTTVSSILPWVLLSIVGADTRNAGTSLQLIALNSRALRRSTAPSTGTVGAMTILNASYKCQWYELFPSAKWYACESLPIWLSANNATFSQFRRGGISVVPHMPQTIKWWNKKSQQEDHKIDGRNLLKGALIG